MKPFFCMVILVALCSAASAQSPSSIGGRTIQLTVASGSFPFVGSGAYRFLPSAMSSAYAIAPITPNIAASHGTHIYAKTGVNTAQLSLTDSVAGHVTVAVTFSATSSGTFVLTSTQVPGASQTGTFVIYSGPSPNSITGQTIAVTVTSGSSPFFSTGSYRFLPAVDGSGYIVEGDSQGIPNSSGTYLYDQNSSFTGVIAYDDSMYGTGLSSQLSFETANSGTVFLTKSGSSGYQTGVFTMTVEVVPPSIAQQPESGSFAQGSSATLSVTATGTPPLNYQWRKSGIGIPGADSASYVIASFQETDQGTYDVVVTNSVGSVTSGQATLSLKLESPTITRQPTSGVFAQGSSVTNSVTATGYPPPNYQWRKGGVDISGANSASYVILSFQDTDQGAYDVVVSNSLGSVTSNTATLSIGDPPKIVYQDPSSDTWRMEGDIMIIGKLWVSGEMPMYFQWRKDGVDIPLVGANGPSYVIRSVNQSHEGTYDVKVTNVAGSDVSQPIRLDVHKVATVPPVFIQTGYSATTGFSAMLDGQPDTVNRIGWTTDFVTWNWIPAYVVLQDSTVSISDPNATSDSLRFYQAVSVEAFVPLP